MWARNTATLLCEVMASFIVAFSGFWNTVVLFLSSLRFSKWLLLHYFAPCRFNVSYEIVSVFKVFDSSALQLCQSEFYCSALERVVRKHFIHTIFIWFAPHMEGELNFSKCRFLCFVQCIVLFCPITSARSNGRSSLEDWGMAENTCFREKCVI